MHEELIQYLEQQKIILKEINSILRRQNREIQNDNLPHIKYELGKDDRKRIHVILTITVVSALFISVMYVQYENQTIINAIPRLTNSNSNYVIQNLQGDTVDTWVAWNVANGRVIHVHIENEANLPQNMLDGVKNVIVSTKTLTVDSSQTDKVPKGTSSIFYEGWQGAAAQAYAHPTKLFIPQKFDIDGSPEGVGDVEIILTSDVNPDGYSGYTKSLVDGNQILKSKITIFKANKLDADRLEAIVRHEFGHAMGLGHSTDSEDLMSPVLPDYPYISGCDIDALKGLYDGNKNSKVICTA